MSYYRHYAYFCLLHLSSLNHSTRSTAGWQITVTTQHAEEVKIGEVILKNPHTQKKSCFTYLSKVIIREFSNTKIQEKRPEKKNTEKGKILVSRIILSLAFFLGNTKLVI